MRLNLDKMLKEYNAEETTGKIRELKHSKLINEDITKFLLFKKKYNRLAQTNIHQFKQMARKHCHFLYDNYTNIFNRLLNDNLNLQILARFLSVLKRIEDGEIDQHEGSYEVGSLLKELYIDSVMRQDKRAKENEKKKKKPKKPVKKLSWSRYKQMMD